MAMPRKDSGDFVFEEFVPSTAWTEDSTCHCLFVCRPGFKKEWLELQVDNYGHVLVSGEEQERKNKFIHFHQKFELAENSDVENISGRYVGEILYVTIPKKVKEVEGWNRITISVEEKQEDSKEDEKGNKAIANGVEENEEDSKEDEKRDKGNANGIEKWYTSTAKKKNKNRTKELAMVLRTTTSRRNNTMMATAIPARRMRTREWLRQKAGSSICWEVLWIS